VVLVSQAVENEELLPAAAGVFWLKD